MDLKSKKVKTADFKVIEFNKEFKRVVVSHTGIFRDEEKKNVKKTLKQKCSSSSNEEIYSWRYRCISRIKRKMEEGK
jgi:small subunit ribosomal protein S1